MIRRMLPAILPALLLALLGTSAASAEIGRVKRAYGQAQVRRGAAVIAAAPGQVLLEHDILQTGSDGRISVSFIDNTRFSVGPNSRVAVAQFAFDETTHQGGSFVTQVDRGSLAVVSGQIAKERKDAMRVRTPTSVLGVRGTRFVVTVK